MNAVIKNWLLTGDPHGNFTRFRNYDLEVQKDPETAVIMLGDVGLNWTLTEDDNNMKNFLSKRYAFRMYCLRGNHEARPSKVADMELVEDEDVKGEVYIQKRWPNIRYLKDYALYEFGGHRTFVIGGAYSVDKWYRLQNGYRWYDDEQLTSEERKACKRAVQEAGEVDFVFSHTCPLCWEPTDLFLSGLDQNTVDKTMERFLDSIVNEFQWKIWCFGHYHADRIERPYVEQFYKDTDSLETVYDRWNTYRETKELDWWLVKSPNFFMGT